MSNDLISRKTLLNLLYDWWLSETPNGSGELIIISGKPQKTTTMQNVERFMKAVEEQPEALSMKKIIEEMEALMESDISSSEDIVWNNAIKVCINTLTRVMSMSPAKEKGESK